MKEYKVERRRRDKSDRATVDKVLDKRTVKILEKLQARNKLVKLRGSLCTGKESNVYVAEASRDLCSKFIKNRHDTETGDGAHTGEDGDPVVAVAVKIFKTSIMPFKDRERYIRSEKRFQTFCTSNPRKLVKLWAEKEVRNLKRLRKASIPSPEPIYLKNNVLVMTLVGSYEHAAPRLRDAVIDDMEGCYGQCIEIIGDMYRKAGLVHADLSEFNLLYLEGTVYVIDVGQSVETGHDNAQRFLIMDINNINSFFAKRGVDVRRGNEIFEDITGHRIPSYLKDVSIGRDTFIPCRVSEVGNEEDLEMFRASDEDRDEECSELSLESSEEDTGDMGERTCGREEEGRGSASLREQRKAMKRLTKESNRVRRASRICNKEKKKIFKKYTGMRRRR